MDEKALLDWKEANKEVYSKFKQDLEKQLLQPYQAEAIHVAKRSVCFIR